jgi:hypothetical protein
MSREAYEVVMRDYETFDPPEVYADKICVYEVSKVIRGRFRVAEHGAQDCDHPSCHTLKQAGDFEAELEAGPCDSEQSKALSGKLEGPFVAAYKDGDTTNRGGQTGKFKWSSGGTVLVGRLRGVINAGTHYGPIGDCEKCYTLNHVEGWLRAAVVEGDHEGCRLAAMYALKLDTEGGFVGTLEGLLICQCE